MLPRICIQDSIIAGKPRPVLWADIEAAMRQPSVQDICDKIKLLDGKDPDEMALLKKHLPIITPHTCRFRGDGARRSSNAVPSGLVMLDIDHIDDPRDFFSRWIAQQLTSENKIYFVAITPSGHGLRVIAEREPEESIPAAQKRLATWFALTEFDAVTKDLARASYLMPWSYVLYCEPAGLNFGTPEQEAIVTTHFAQLEAQSHTTTLPQQNVSESPQEKSAPSGEDLGGATFRGIEYAAIVRELENLLGGTPAMGERNQFYFTLVRYMRYICDFNADKCVAVLPDYGLSLGERHATAMSSVNRPRKGDMPELLQRAITAAEHALNNDTEGSPIANSQSPNSLPPLPRVLELICRRLPEPFRPAMVIAALPILGALATRVRFQYLDKQEHSFSFMSCITAPAATGKSFIRKPVNLLLTPIDRQDELERKREEEYKEALRAAKNSKMQPTNPRACPRNNGINVSIAKLLQLLAYSDGKHLIGIGEEIDTLVKSERAGVWSQKSDIYRLGFDNAKYGQNYMSDNSFSANVPVFYNLLLTGTPGGMYRFFKDVEDGLVTRFCFAQLPDMFGSDIPAFENYTEAEEREIIDIAECLDKAAGTIACSHVGVRIRRWLNEKRDIAIREDSRAVDTLRKRAAVIGYRAGMLAYLLNECVYEKSVGEFASWVAEYVFQNQMQLFGSKFEEVAQSQLVMNERKSCVVSLLQQLSEQFTRNELMALRARNGQSTRVDMVLNRWKSSGFITQVDKTTYKKTPKAHLPK
ncbi:MAG: DUF3987 domain-containing protein [Paludibacteraceae bacterium]|nr:DUF3987 domain-containing protein [Paludibacteraceae bacterium]